MSFCDCEDWEPNSKIINNYVIFAVNHSLTDYKKAGGKDMIYCPWCGHRLEEENGRNTQS